MTRLFIVLSLLKLALQCVAVSVTYPADGSREIPLQFSTKGAWTAGHQNGDIRLYEYAGNGKTLVASRREAATPSMTIPSSSSNGNSLKKNTKYRLEYQDNTDHQAMAVSEFWTITTPPRIHLVVDQEGEFREGDSVRIHAMVDGGSGPIETVQWKANGTPLGGATGESLDFQFENAGLWTIGCRATGPGGKKADSIISFSVAAVPPPSISLLVSPSEAITEGDEVTITAVENANSGPISNYVWHYNDQLLEGQESVSIAVEAKPGLSRVYCDVVGFKNQTARAQAALSAETVAPPSISLAVFPSGPVQAGTSYAIIVVENPETGPIDYYEWKRNGVILDGEIGEWIARREDTVGTVTYTSSAFGFQGRTGSATVTVSIVAASGIEFDLSANPGNVVTEKTPIILTASANQGSIAINSFVWSHDGVVMPGLTNNSMVLEGKLTDAGTYNCKAINGSHEQSKSISIIVKPAGPGSNGNFRLGIPSLREGGEIAFTFEGDVGKAYLIEYTEDFKIWETLYGIILEEPTTEISDFPEDSRLRFYRAYEVAL